MIASFLLAGDHVEMQHLVDRRSFYSPLRRTEVEPL